MRPEAEQDFRREITRSQNAKTNLNHCLTIMFIVIWFLEYSVKTHFFNALNQYAY